ncbi:MAG: hypothetical protein H6510_14055 [Acidobacteria bacterium]|nr:hypothetical protein [Acidobacteriota bacterium]MCB9398932.1 hypothetical protein [Acidobacteriota bacterium]
MKYTIFLLFLSFVWADDTTLIVQEDEAAAGLDLQAVVQLASEVEDTEAFERALNDERRGINNMDLNDDGQVDYIRVVTQNDDDAFVYVLQVPLAEDAFQDVATVQIEKDRDGEVRLQVQGDIDIYGPDVYYVPAPTVQVSLFPLVRWTFSPLYRPWVSPWHWSVRPVWWSPFRVVPFTVYRPRVTTYTRINVHVTKVSHVTRCNTVYKTRTTSTKVVKTTHASKTKVVHEGAHGGTTKVTHGHDGEGNRGTKVTHENSKTGRSQSVAVKKEADGDKSVKVKKSKTNESGTTTKSVKKSKSKDGKTTTTKKKTKTKEKAKKD